MVAVKTGDLVATDNSMGVPEDWKSSTPKATKVGHQEAGRTIVLHSVAILPSFQGRGLGRVLMMAYMQQMNGAGIADRLALIAHDVRPSYSSFFQPRSRLMSEKHKVEWYEKLGFVNKGPGKAQFGGGGWIDMVRLLRVPEGPLN